jgi:glycosyltransferase involved in cell wall biosynthesis
MKVSIIIPFRERNKVLERCVEAVKEQTYKNIEIILVSDKAKFENENIISLINTNCKGVGEKRNFGAKRATGNIFFFLDSDCILKKDSVQKLVEIFKKHKTDAVSGKPLAPKKSNIIGIATGLEYEDRFNQMEEDYVNVAATTCLGVIKESFKKIKGFSDYTEGEATGEDWDFSVKLRRKGLKIFHTNQVAGYHEQVSNNLFYYLNRQKLHAEYRVKHYKKYKKSVDEYSSWKMLISSSILLSLPTIIRIYRETKNSKIFILPFISFFRSIFWFVGLIEGIIKD